MHIRDNLFFFNLKNIINNNTITVFILYSKIKLFYFLITKKKKKNEKPFTVGLSGGSVTNIYSRGTQSVNSAEGWRG